MKKKNVVFTVAGTLTAVATGLIIAYTNVKATNEYYKNAEIKLPDGFTVTAHTACEGTEDNSVEAMKKGVECGANTVEFDLSVNSKGVPVLAHTYPEKAVATLSEAFDFLSEHPDIKANIDVKTDGRVGFVQSLAKEKGILGQIFFTGIELEEVPAVKETCPDVPYYLNMELNKKKLLNENYIKSLVETTKEAGAIGINLNFKQTSQALVDAFHESGLLVSVWTVNTENDMQRMLYYAPDNITTKQVTLLKGIINEKSVTK